MRKDEQLIQWRNNILKNWKKKCAMCNKKGKGLNAHHIISKSVKELKYDTNNGILLCPSCHVFNRLYSAHKGAYMFIKWLRNNHPDICLYIDKKLNVINGNEYTLKKIGAI